VLIALFVLLRLPQISEALFVTDDTSYACLVKWRCNMKLLLLIP